jgi:hypothetical protein
MQSVKYTAPKQRLPHIRFCRISVLNNRLAFCHPILLMAVEKSLARKTLFKTSLVLNESAYIV